MGYGNLQNNQFEIRKFKTKISKIYFVLLHTSKKDKYTNQSYFFYKYKVTQHNNYDIQNISMTMLTLIQNISYSEVDKILP